MTEQSTTTQAAENATDTKKTRSAKQETKRHKVKRPTIDKKLSVILLEANAGKRMEDFTAYLASSPKSAPSAHASRLETLLTGLSDHLVVALKSGHDARDIHAAFSDKYLKIRFDIFKRELQKSVGKSSHEYAAEVASKLATDDKPAENSTLDRKPDDDEKMAELIRQKDEAEKAAGALKNEIGELKRTLEEVKSSHARDMEKKDAENKKQAADKTHEANASAAENASKSKKFDAAIPSLDRSKYSPMLKKTADEIDTFDLLTTSLSEGKGATGAQ